MSETDKSCPSPVFVYSSDYDMDLGPDRFPAIKYGYVYMHLVEDRRFRKHCFREPAPLATSDLALVHRKAYIRDLINLEPSFRTRRGELPMERSVVEAFLAASGGTLLAARIALEQGSAMNLGGGFHHAFADRAEGFCLINDVAIAIRVLKKEGRIRRALVVDLDVHQGNGSARIFRFDRSVFTFSMHEERNYPRKEKGSLDVGLETAMHDEEYLTILSRALQTVSRRFSPDIIFYLAGADPYESDRLGGLSLTMNGLAERDRMVRDFMPGVPLVTVLAGGYSVKTEDTIQIHVQTASVLAGFQ